ncbi:Mitochondrial carrier domain [Pseudocohnilembus persalinus]|uniref:Mitochondrial carrier domain n=1 Tax=Pseudocohnilembus persalinus TaxID=266149 RepID=A0A0V0R0X7_PSEPJ|nr:Mitochondrial carrier domain [Pseudocohnilembus persalinus]|eukprot:KRX08185.1 Mitochondrial carrier domain [Pseudocohnilembus persalinus]
MENAGFFLEQDNQTATFNAKDFSPFKLSAWASLAYFVADLLIYPIDTLATRQRANVEFHTTIKQEYRNVMKSPAGYKGMYKGYSTVFYSSYVPQFAYFYLYESISYKSYQYFKTLKDQNSGMEKLKHVVPFVASTLGEIVALLLYLPIDIIRTRMQIDSPSYQYKNMFDGWRQIIKKEGILRMYKASHIYITVTTLQTALQFQAYEWLRNFFIEKQDKEFETKQYHLSIQNSIFVTLASTGIATFLVNPLDLVLTRFQVTDSSSKKLSGRQIVKDLLKDEGWKGFLKGLNARMIYCCAYGVLWMPIYDYFKGSYGANLDF